MPCDAGQEISEIKPYQDSGKYIVIFKGPAKKIAPIKTRESSHAPQGPIYTKYENLISARYLEDAMES